MDLTITCSRCGKSKTVELLQTSGNGGSTLAKLIRNAGWIVVLNNDDMHVYCPVGCAQ